MFHAPGAELWTGGGARAAAVRGSSVQSLRPGRTALTVRAQELVGHGGADGVQAAAAAAGGAGIAPPHPRLLMRVSGSGHAAFGPVILSLRGTRPGEAAAAL